MEYYDNNERRFKETSIQEKDRIYKTEIKIKKNKVKNDG
jgi:hypothetical protein